jgi:hypothetical protein
VSYLGDLVRVIVLVPHRRYLRSKFNNVPNTCVVRLGDASFCHSTYNNPHHQNVVVCIMERKVEERVWRYEDNEVASYYTSYAHGA